jgi:hypothetical protein
MIAIQRFLPAKGICTPKPHGQKTNVSLVCFYLQSFLYFSRQHKYIIFLSEVTWRSQ